LSSPAAGDFPRTREGFALPKAFDLTPGDLDLAIKLKEGRNPLRTREERKKRRKKEQKAVDIRRVT
jgi:hypothetical protein